MNATAAIDIASAEDALSIPSYAVVRGNYVLVTKDSPSAVNADTSMNAPDGYVYVKVTTGISDDDYIAVTSASRKATPSPTIPLRPPSPAATSRWASRAAECPVAAVPEAAAEHREVASDERTH